MFTTLVIETVKNYVIPLMILYYNLLNKYMWGTKGKMFARLWSRTPLKGVRGDLAIESGL